LEQEKVQVEVKVEVRAEVKAEDEVEIREKILVPAQASTRLRILLQLLPGVRRGALREMQRTFRRAVGAAKRAGFLLLASYAPGLRGTKTYSESPVMNAATTRSNSP